MVRRFAFVITVSICLTAEAAAFSSEPLLLQQAAATTPSGQEPILSKTDADYVFSRTRQQWERDSNAFFGPGRVVTTKRFDTGTLAMVVDQATGVGVSVQPFYRNDFAPPELVMITNFFPIGFLPPMTEELKKDMEAAAQKDLAPTYSVRMRYRSTEGKDAKDPDRTKRIEVIEFFITKAK